MVITYSQVDHRGHLLLLFVLLPLLLLAGQVEYSLKEKCQHVTCSSWESQLYQLEVISLSSIHYPRSEIACQGRRGNFHISPFDLHLERL